MISAIRSWIAARVAPRPVYFEIARLDLKPGDVLVLKTDVMLTADMRKRLQQYVAEVVPDFKTLVLERGFDLAVLHGDRLDFVKKDAAA